MLMQQSPQPSSTPRLPAEWEKQSGVMLTWPHADTDWRPYLDDITQTYLQLADAITQREHLLVATPFPDATKTLLSQALTPGQMERVSIYETASNDTWARDHGPITLSVPQAPAASEDSGHRLLDFRFNGWGEKFAWEKDNAITRHLYARGAFADCTLERHDDFVLEGGSIESDGQGTVFTTSQCLLAPHRNQPLSRQDIEQRLKTLLHARRIVWIDHGNLVGDDTDGHIDTIVRVAPDNTLLYVGCDNPEDEQYADFQALQEQLGTLRTIEGKPYRLLKLPMPEAVYDDGERLPATYANFLIINGAVIYPTYAQPQNDEEARRTLQEAFSRHTLVPIDSRTIIRQHGSIHCLTMQLPEGIIR